jgi:hypothetical protein
VAKGIDNGVGKSFMLAMQDGFMSEPTRVVGVEGEEECNKSAGREYGGITDQVSSKLSSNDSTMEEFADILSRDINNWQRMLAKYKPVKVSIHRT